MVTPNYWVYIMASRSRTLYVGFTDDLHQRVFEHKSGIGCYFTTKYRVVRLMYYEEFMSV